MKSQVLKSFSLVVATGLMLVAGLNTSGVAQGRGAGTIAVPIDRRGPVVSFPTPTRRVTDIDRTRRDEIERRRRDDDERRRRDDDERRRRIDRERRGLERPEDETRRRHQDDGNRFQPFARWLGVEPERLQNAYQSAKGNNPDLRFSQFFSALVIAHRVNGSNPNVTAQAILRGLDSGMGMQRTLVALGMTAEEAKNAVKWAERIFNYLKP